MREFGDDVAIGQGTQSIRCGLVHLSRAFRQGILLHCSSPFTWPGKWTSGLKKKRVFAHPISIRKPADNLAPFRLRKIIGTESQKTTASTDTATTSGSTPTRSTPSSYRML